MRISSRFPRIGFIYAMLAALLWAASGSAAKYLFSKGVTPFELVQLRMTLGAAGLGLIFLVRRPGLMLVKRNDLPRLAVLGICLAAAQFAYLYAISLIQVAAAILLQYQAPVIIAVYGIVRGKERLAAMVGASVVMSVFGCYLVVGGLKLNFSAMNPLGILVGISAAFTFAWYTIMSGETAKKYSPETSVFYALAFAAVAWNLVHPPFSAFSRPYDFGLWLWIAGIGIVGTIAPFGLYMAAVRLIQPTRASITATLEPIFAAAMAWTFLGETLNNWQAFGAVLVVAAIVVLQIRSEPVCYPQLTIKYNSVNILHKFTSWDVNVQNQENFGSFPPPGPVSVRPGSKYLEEPVLRHIAR